jgi:hypothetical protein
MKDGSTEIDLDQVELIVYHVVTVKDEYIGGGTGEDMPVGMEIDRVVWRDKSKGDERIFPSATVFANENTERDLLQYGKDHPFSPAFPWPIEPRESTGIKIYTRQWILQKEEEEHKKAIKWFIESASKGPEADKKAEEALMKIDGVDAKVITKKDENDYTFELIFGLIIAEVVAFPEWWKVITIAVFGTILVMVIKNWGPGRIINQIRHHFKNPSA